MASLLDGIRQGQSEQADDDSKSEATFKNIQNKGDLVNFKEDLIYGYVRMQYEDKENIVVPVEVIKIIIFFYQDGMCILCCFIIQSVLCAFLCQYTRN